MTRRVLVVSDVLPTSSKADYLFDTGGCTLSSGVLTCALGNMTAGSVKSFNVHVRVKGSAGQISNTASVSSSTFDPDVSNNSSTRVVLVKGGTWKTGAGADGLVLVLRGAGVHGGCVHLCTSFGIRDEGLRLRD